MTERIRSSEIRVSLVVDTNKRTIRRALERADGEELEEFLERVREEYEAMVDVC